MLPQIGSDYLEHLPSYRTLSGVQRGVQGVRRHRAFNFIQVC